jgi:hypothetical protein
VVRESNAGITATTTRYILVGTLAVALVVLRGMNHGLMEVKTVSSDLISAVRSITIHTKRTGKFE